MTGGSRLYLRQAPLQVCPIISELGTKPEALQAPKVNQGEPQSQLCTLAQQGNHQAHLTASKHMASWSDKAEILIARTIPSGASALAPAPELLHRGAHSQGRCFA